MMATSSNSQSSVSVISSSAKNDCRPTALHGVKHDEMGKSKEQLHRYVSVERLGAYSDAVFSIIVTFMIIPLSTSVEGFKITENVRDNLLEEWHRFVIYAACYFLVFSIWENHVRLYEAVEHVGDVTIVINVIQLLAVSMLPFLGALLGDYNDDPLATLLFACCLAAVALLQILGVYFAYRRKKMMTEDMHKREITIESCASAAVLLFLVAVAAALAYVNQIPSWVFLGLALFADTISIIPVAIYKRSYPDEKYDTKGYIAHRLITRRSNTDRLKNFTDGVFAIVATLIILDLTNAAANPTNSGPGSIKLALQGDKQTFFSYFATFSTVGMIWYVHYTVFHPIYKVSRVTGLFNKWVLLFVGLLPMGFKLISKYSTDTWDKNENAAIQFNCVVIFGATFCQFCTWLSGHWKRHKHLHEGYGRVHICWCLILCLVYPCISLILFLVALTPLTLDANAVQAIQVSIPLLFCVIKICFEIFVHKYSVLMYSSYDVYTSIRKGDPFERESLTFHGVLDIQSHSTRSRSAITGKSYYRESTDVTETTTTPTEKDGDLAASMTDDTNF